MLSPVTKTKFLLLIVIVAFFTAMFFLIAIFANRDLKNEIWRIEGDPEYFEETKNLGDPRASKFLPHGFNYKKLGNVKGIWGIFPKDENGCLSFDNDNDNNDSGKWALGAAEKETCDRSASTSFHVKSFFKVEEIVVTYAFGGDNATLRLLSGKEVMWTLNSHASNTVEGWFEFASGVDRHMLTLQANVGGLGSYILINRLILREDVPIVPQQNHNHCLLQSVISELIFVLYGCLFYIFLLIIAEVTS